MQRANAFSKNSSHHSLHDQVLILLFPSWSAHRQLSVPIKESAVKIDFFPHFVTTSSFLYFTILYPSCFARGQSRRRRKGLTVHQSGSQSGSTRFPPITTTQRRNGRGRKDELRLRKDEKTSEDSTESGPSRLQKESEKRSSDSNIYKLSSIARMC